MRKGMNPLETIFLLIILLIVVVVMINMFTRFMGRGSEQLGTTLEDINEAMGYQKAISQCQQACNDIKLNRDMGNQIRYCTMKIGIDINMDKSIDSDAPYPQDYNSNRPIYAPSIGYVVCEKNVYCPMITQCGSLTMERCKELLCDYWIKRQGGYNDPDAIEAASNMLKMAYNPGECDLDELINLSETHKNWYKDGKFDTCSDGGTNTQEISTSTQCESNSGVCTDSFSGNNCDYIDANGNTIDGTVIGRCTDDNNKVCCKNQSG